MKSRARVTNLAAGAAALAMAATTALFVGCGSESGADGTGVPDAISTSGPPTLSELTAAVDLTERQGVEITPPLERWQTRDSRMRRARQDGNLDRDDSFEPPVMGFLEDSAPILEHDQFLTMVSWLGERRDQAREQMRARRGDGDGPGGGNRGEGRGRFGNGDGPGFGGGPGGFVLGRLVRELDLDDAARARLMDAAKAHREAMRALHEQYRKDAIGDEAFRDQAKAARTAFETELSGILGAEGFARYQELKTEQRVRFAERRLEKLGDGIDRRVEFLTKVLELDATQVGQVREALKARLPAWGALLTSLRDGGIQMEDFHFATRQLRDEGRAALEAVLTPGQIETLAALDDLMPGRGGHRGRRG